MAFSGISINDRAFIPNVLKDQGFQTDGYLAGQSDGVSWVVVDPPQYPLVVWSKSGSADYVESGQALGAVAFTNGPMMEHLSMAKRMLAGGAAGVVLVGGVATYLAPVGPKGWAIAGLAAAVGALIGAGIGATTGKRGRPFREVRGQWKGIYDEGNRNNSAHFWLRRQGGTGFDNYDVAAGPATPRFKGAKCEVIDGLIALIHNHAATSSTKGSPHYNEPYARLAPLRAACWSLVPTPGVAVADTPPAEGETRSKPLAADELGGIDLGSGASKVKGVLVATCWDGSIADMQKILLTIGARDSVAMDGNNSQMLGTMAHLFYRSSSTRERLLDYGFGCVKGAT